MIAPNWYPNKKELRQFAVVSLFGFGLLGLVAHLRFGLEITAHVLLAIGGLTFLIGLVSHKAVLFIYLALMAITFPIGWLISNFFLRILFYGILTSVGLILRLFGRDPLRLKRPQTDSYWLEKKGSTTAASYYRQA